MLQLQTLSKSVILLQVSFRRNEWLITIMIPPICGC